MEVQDLAAYKHELLMRSEAYRQTFRGNLFDVNRAFAWVPRAAHTLRFGSPLLLILAPAAAFLAGRWRLGKAPAVSAKRSLFARIFAGIRIFQQVKPMVDGFLKARAS